MQLLTSVNNNLEGSKMWMKMHLLLHKHLIPFQDSIAILEFHSMPLK
jgi:hypothetical protein